jgi:phosphonatase-like hydrolase
MTALPSTAFRLAVFDVAGTTVLDGDAVVECLLAVLEKRMPMSRQQAVEVMGLPKPVAIRQLLVAAGDVSDQALAAAVDDAYAEFRHTMIERYRSGPLAPVEGAEQVFSALQQAGVRVALDTGFSRDILDTVLERLGWKEGIIDFSLASDEVERGRPYPDLIHRAMALADVAAPSSVIKIGDTPSDLEEGLAAGCGLVVGVTYGTHTHQQLARPGVTLIDNLPALLPLIGIGVR